jgi:hypothetical protein
MRVSASRSDWASILILAFDYVLTEMFFAR